MFNSNYCSDRSDYRVIADLIPERAKILDLGCGRGDLLKILEDRKKICGFGIEIDEAKVISCVSKGVSVHHGDLETVLAEYPDKSFDFVILSLTLQAVRHPSNALGQMLRVGKKAIVSFPNFAYLPIRVQLAIKGRMPRTSALPYEWYNTPNIHLTTIKDFTEYCGKCAIKIERAVYFGLGKTIVLLPNLMANEALFVLRCEAGQNRAPQKTKTIRPPL